MKSHILQLAAIARKRTRLIIGLMSGTSLDGLDVALCAFTGAGSRTRVKVLHFKTLPYDAHFKDEIRRVFAKKEIDFQHLVLLNVLIAERHADIVNRCLADWNIAAEDVDLLASHGQTVYHAPRVLHGLPGYPNATLQIGDGDHLARRTGIITISDFRQKHLAAGGEGAPLALYGDFFLFSKKGENRFLLNIGGIANFTYLPADGDTTQAFATDTGPGNTLIDAFARALFGVPYDENALLAKAGRVDERLLDILKADPFFAKPFPKTTGPELFSPEWVQAAFRQLPKGNPNPYDLMATLTKLTADTIVDALDRVSQSPIPNPQSLYLSGGGAHNPLIAKHLKAMLPGWKIKPMKALGVDGDAKEAVLFAVLANETVAGSTTTGTKLGGIPLVGMGKISFPG
ncbi:MAG TPA: anhydro-N-acetylmuramic acid kinase [Saprospiraceae bacterium]|nr:anhydro-N-acetylmuramic acid kinase [Saprospiraceae bacterium]